MQFLRMLTNGIVGGALFSAYLVLLVLHLNPALDLRSAEALRPLLTWFAVYAVHAAAAFYVLIVIRQVLAVEMPSIGWISLRLLTWVGAAAAGAGAAIIWMNVRGFGAALGPEIVGPAVRTAGVLAAAAAACAVLGIVQRRSNRGRRLSGWLFALVVLASLVVPVLLRGAGATPVLQARRFNFGEGLVFPGGVRRVSMILLDGASLDFVSPIAAAGRLPNFGRLLDNGAVMHLATIRPTHAAPVWTAVATGKLPYKNGVRSPATYQVPDSGRPLDLLPDFCFAQGVIRFGFVNEVPHTAAAVRARPLWSILSGFGISTGLVGWPLTFPAAPVNGYLVSEPFLRSAVQGSTLARSPDAPAAIYPADLADEARAACERAEAGAGRERPRLDSGPEPGETSGAPMDPFAIDGASERTAADLQRTSPADFTAVRYPGLDAVGHYYLRYAVPPAFGQVSEEDRRRFGRVLEQYYAYVDGILGRAVAALGPDDVLVVVSGFGMEPLSPGKLLLETALGNTALSGTHERAPDGFLLAYGRPVAPGRRARASVVDVAPTVLYLLGLPIGRDMDGYARTDLFTAAFTAARPITFIPSYDP